MQALSREASVSPASLPLRLLARVLDVVAMAWLATVIVVEVEGALFDDRTFIQLAVTSIVVALAYEILPTAYRGVTVGKAMLGLRVVTPDGRQIGLARSLLRYILLLLAFSPQLFLVPLVPLALPAFLDRRRRALHDFAAGTMVVASR